MMDWWLGTSESTEYTIKHYRTGRKSKSILDTCSLPASMEPPDLIELEPSPPEPPPLEIGHKSLYQQIKEEREWKKLQKCQCKAIKIDWELLKEKEYNERMRTYDFKSKVNL